MSDGTFRSVRALKRELSDDKGGSLLFCVNVVAAACDLPALVILPAAGTVGDASAQLIVDMQRSIADADAFIAEMEKESAGAAR